MVGILITHFEKILETTYCYSLDTKISSALCLGTYKKKTVSVEMDLGNPLITSFSFLYLTWYSEDT